MAYVPSQHITVAASLGFSQATPTDARSLFWDAVNGKYRAYQNTAEVLAYLTLAKYRFGHFPIYINTGGSLSAGVWTGGTTSIWWFRDGQADGNLVELFDNIDVLTPAWASQSSAFTLNVAAPRVNVDPSGAAITITPLSLGAAAGVDFYINVLNNANPVTFSGSINGVSGMVLPIGINVLSADTTTYRGMLTGLYSFRQLTGVSWNIGTNPRIQSAISADTNYTTTGGTSGLSTGIMIITKTGSGQVTVNGTAYDTRDNGKTAISVARQLDGTYYVSSDYQKPSLSTDTTSPLVSSVAVTGPHTIRVTLNEASTGTDTGLSFEDGGSPITINAHSQFSPSIIDFTITETMAAGEVITYAFVSSDIHDTAGNFLANTSGTATNAIPGAPQVMTVTAIDDHTIEVVFNKPCDGTGVGLDFADGGSPLTKGTITGIGTSTWTIPIVEAMTLSSVLTWAAVSADIQDQEATPNPLANASGSVTNTIGGGGNTTYNFDGSLSLPAGLTASAGTAVIASGLAVSSPNVLRLAKTGGRDFVFDTTVRNHTTSVKCWVNKHSTEAVELGLVLCSQSLTSLDDAYILSIALNTGPKMYLAATTGGSLATLATTSPVLEHPIQDGNSTGNDSGYNIEFAFNHTTKVLTGYCQRVATMLWYDTSGNYASSSKVAGVTYTVPGSILAAGNSAVFSYQPTSAVADLIVDNLVFAP